MNLTKKQIKAIEKLTGLKYIDYYKFSNIPRHHQRIEEYIPKTGRINLEIDDDGIKYTIYYCPGDEASLEFPQKWLIPLGKILGGKDE